MSYKTIATRIKLNAKSHKKELEKYQPNSKAIDINLALPYLAITMPNGKEFFFQDEEASNLISEIENSKLSNYCSLEDILLWEASGW